MGIVPPQCVDVEEIILASAISNSDNVSTICRKCKEEMFYKEDHVVIFRAIATLYADGSPVDMILLMSQLKKTKELDLIGGAYAITELANRVIATSNIDWHIAILWQTWQKRKIIELNSRYMQQAFDDSTDPIDLVLSLYAELDDMKSIFESSKKVTIENVVEDTMKNILRRATGEIPSFMRTGHEKFDEIARIDTDRIILIGGAAKHMKTRFLISIMINLFGNYSERMSALWYCLEDGTENLLKIILSNMCHLDIDKLDSINNKMSDQEYDLVERMSKRIGQWDIEYRDDTKPIKLISADFASFCKRREGRSNVLIIDNALLIDNKENDRDDIIMNELVKLKKATKGMIIVVHHFNSEQQNKDNLKSAYRPALNDLKGREAYRRVPDLILLVNRPGMYPSLTAEYVGYKDIFEHLFIIDIAANRKGKAGQDDKTLLRFWVLPDYSQFEEI
jgi:replicative DNA helicase